MCSDDDHGAGHHHDHDHRHDAANVPAPLDPDALLRTQDFVRPEFRDGFLTLAIEPFKGTNEYVRFEQPNPHPCCGHH